jgi:site-specific recombinase XerD
MELIKQIEDYLVRHKKRLRTQETYLLRFKQFCVFLSGSPPESATFDQIIEYLTITKKESPSGAQQARAVLDIAYNKVLKKSYAITSFKLDYRKRVVKSYLTESEIKTLFESLSDLKLRCAVGLMYSARLSVGELVDLRLTDIDFENKLVSVKQTSNDRPARRVTLSDYVAEDLQKFRLVPRKTNFWFEQKSAVAQNSTDWLMRAFKKALLKAGITKQITSNSLLDSYIVHLQAQGVLLYQILKEQKLSVGTNLSVYSVLQPMVNKIHSPLDPIMQGTYEGLSDNRPKDPYVSIKILRELEACKSSKFDLQKLIQLCRELNVAYSKNAILSIGILVRVIIDHVPPIFGKTNFSEVVGSHPGGRSFREAMNTLEVYSRKVADAVLHTQIRNKEVLPTFNQVDFRSPLDMLLCEIIRLSK